MDLFKNKLIIAPMVRVSTLPFRLLCLDYGADIVYTEETIDYKMLKSIKVENEILGTTDFVDKQDGIVFLRTSPREKKNLIFQLGTANAQRALKVAKMVENNVAGIDVNMGCPREFSVKGGMGAALLKQPEKVKDILTTLAKNLDIPVTCKIRLLPKLEDTIALVKVIESSGAAAVAIHGRRRDERPRHPNRNAEIRAIVEAVNIPVIANGGSKEINCFEDVEAFRLTTGAASVMVARTAMWNCSFIRREGKLDLEHVITSFLKYCIEYDNPFTLTKYGVQNMLRNRQNTTAQGQAFLETQTLQQISALFGLSEWYIDKAAKVSAIAAKVVAADFSAASTPEELATVARLSNGVLGKSGSRSLMPISTDTVIKEEVIEDGRLVSQMRLPFIRGNFGDADLPKIILYTYAYRNDFSIPSYVCLEDEKLFNATVKVGDKFYRSSMPEKNRRFAEQSSALVALHFLGQVDNEYGLQQTTKVHLMKTGGGKRPVEGEPELKKDIGKKKGKIEVAVL